MADIDGFDLELTAAVSDAVGVPVIASGGVGTLEHLAEGHTQGWGLFRNMLTRHTPELRTRLVSASDVESELDGEQGQERLRLLEELRPDVVHVHSAPTEDAVMFGDELTALEKSHPSFRCHVRHTGQRSRPINLQGRRTRYA